MLKNAKVAVLKAGKASGLFHIVSRSDRLRTGRLLILCYHGVSFEDEHRWNDGLYIDRDTLRRRFEMLRDGGYRVLPLDEALKQLYRSRLPERSVVLTFDDGAYDFYAHAYPLLQEFGFPATLYLSTFYCQYQAPVFDAACAYMLWKSIGKTFDATGFIPEGGELRIPDEPERRNIYIRIYRHLRQRNPSAEEKDELLDVLAARLGFDMTALRSRRMLFYMNPDEVRRVAQGGVDIQLHTHRHRTPREREPFLREIHDNIRAIQDILGSGAVPKHFCYPSGDFAPDHQPWLREAGVESATTCQIGMATSSSNPLELPRLLDRATMSSLEFEGWLTGFSEIFPRRDWRFQIQPFQA